MPIRLKIARTAKELDDVFKLRYDVYVTEQNKFSEKFSISNQRILDHFDGVPGVANVVVYDRNTAVASFRVNKDSAIGLAPEKYLDFSRVRNEILTSGEENEFTPCIVSGSMLAIRKKWRHRRNIIFALFKATTAVMHGWGATHVFGAASAETFSLYGRLGFDRIAEKQWIESVGDSLVPMMAPFAKVFAWAYGQSQPVINNFWLDNYSGQYETILLSPGEVLFREGDDAKYAYSIFKGSISISRLDPNSMDMKIAHLSQGALLGELAMLDGEPRSTTATASINTEVYAIERSQLKNLIHQDSDKMDQLLRHLAKRLRETDHLAMIQSFAPQTNRVMYALRELWDLADPEKDQATTRVAQANSRQIAQLAEVREPEVLRILEMRRAAGRLDYGKNIVRFFEEPSSKDVARIRPH